MTDSTNERIERLEERFAFLEHDVEQMSKVVRALGDQADAMARQLSRLRHEMRAAAPTSQRVPSEGDPATSDAPNPSPDDLPQPPPHWGRRPGEA